VSGFEEREHGSNVRRLLGLVFLILLLTAASGQCQGVDAATSASRTSSADATTSATRSAGAQRAVAAVLSDAALGPVFRLCLGVALLGALYRTWQFRKLTRSVHRKRSLSSGFLRAACATAPGGVRRRTASHPVMRTASLSFHVLLFAVPLFLPAHNLILHRSLHVSLPAIPAPLADWLTVVLICIGAFFLARRLFVPRVRVLSTLYDYAILLLALGPFVTGLMVHHHVSSCPWLMIAHVASGDLLLLAVPFTKLGHMPFLLFSRLFISSEYALRSGKRAWGARA
jgi:nitrate reductase gamma subunit